MGRKYKSRVTRCNDAIAILEEYRNRLEELKENFDEDIDEKELDVIVGEVCSIASEPDVAELESLKEELESWRDGMTGTNLENTEKYQTLESSVDALDNVISEVQGLEEPKLSEDGSVKEKAEELEVHIDEMIGKLEDAISEAESIEFPGMFG